MDFKAINKIKRPFQISWNFLNEVKNELKKVSWLNKKQVYEYTAIVIGLSLTAAVFIGFWDRLFAFLFNKFIL